MKKNGSFADKDLLLEPFRYTIRKRYENFVLREVGFSGVGSVCYGPVFDRGLFRLAEEGGISVTQNRKWQLGIRLAFGPVAAWNEISVVGRMEGGRRRTFAEPCEKGCTG